MIVAFDSSPLGSGHKSRGIGFYTKHLLSALNDLHEITIEEFSDLSRIKSADLIHYPYFDLFRRSLPLNLRFPTVVTIHDIIPVLFPAHYPPGLKGSLNLLYQKQALKRVTAVITDSQASKRDIVRHLNYPEERIHTVYLAGGGHFKKINDNKILARISDKYRLPERFVLFIGSVNWNKNLLKMTEGCIQAGVDLVLIGKSFEDKSNLGHPEMRSFRQFLNQYGDHHLVHSLGFVDDDDLVVMTNLAKAVMLPSFAEGFGLPILEAQSCGTPVITSSVSSMPEVAGRGALFINPQSPEEIAQAINNILADQGLREKLIKAGEENVRRFSWKKTAEETYEVYKKVISA